MKFLIYNSKINSKLNFHSRKLYLKEINKNKYRL